MTTAPGHDDAGARTADADPGAADDLHEVAAELRSTLGRLPRRLPARWLYDDRGSELFTRITELPEYYPTEAERSILVARSADIAERTGATTVVELGSGTSDKTRTLLEAFVAHGAIERFAPLDVSEATLLDAATLLRSRHPTIEVTPIVGDFTRHLGRIAGVASSGPRLVAFLGGTIGNFGSDERAAFLAELAAVLDPGDWVLIGIDRAKDVGRVLAAYDDPAGATEEFIRNALVHVNAACDGDLDVGAFGYVPFWDGRRERVDMRLRAERPVTARLRAIDLDLDLATGEEIRIEISTKFRPGRVVDELARAGLGAEADVLTDPAGDFALVLARRDDRAAEVGRVGDARHVGHVTSGAGRPPTGR